MDINETNIQEDAEPRYQRFRKKCRARGMKSEKIKKLLEKRKKVNHGQNRINADARITRGAETNTIASNKILTVETTTQSIPTATKALANTHKRKRDDLSQS